MDKIVFPIALTSIVLAVYCLGVLFQIPYALILSLFTALHFLLLWMVYRILRDGTPSQHTFEEKWYEDK